MTDGKPKNAMWGGRFAGGPDAVMERLNASVAFDRRLAEEDIRGSRAHAAMLMAQGIVSREDVEAIDAGLAAILEEIRAGDFVWDPALEDVHLNIEARLKDMIGEAGGRLHTARSRNDQVATDMRLWIRGALDRTAQGVRAVLAALLDKADAHAETVMPGFTHLQSAQPVTFGHHCLAYVEMLARDHGRLMDARARLNECPLGAAALAGTGFPIDRDATAEALGFDRPMANSLDAVSARDFAIEALGALAILAMHLSRLGEEFVLWSTPQFGFVTLSDRFSTGSSIMPQKRNPDAAELIRAKIGRIAGAHQALLMIMKGLPLAYSKDMQEDKEPVFDAFDQMDMILPAMTGMIADMTVNAGAMRAAAGAGFATATDLADWLVREKGVPFREAHHIVGAVVAEAERLGRSLDDMPLAAMRAVDARIGEGVLKALSVEASVASRASYGGAAPVRVRERIAVWRERLGDG